MAAMHFDGADAKLCRALARETKLSKKRSAYQMSQAASGKSAKKPAGHDFAKAHRSVRTAVRTCLANESIATGIDVPMACPGYAGRWVRWCRKPSVSPSLKYSLGNECFSEVDTMKHFLAFEEATTTAPDTSPAYSAVDIGFSFTPLSERQSDEIEESWPERSLPEHSMEVSAIESICAQSNVSPSPVEEAETEMNNSEESASQDKDEDASCKELLKQRKAIMRNVISSQQEAHEVEVQRLHKMLAQARAAEKASLQAAAAAEQEVQLLKAQTATISDLKLGQQLDKQRAAEMRKKEKATAHVQALKSKLDKQTQEIACLRDEIKAEATAKAQIQAAEIEAKTLQEAARLEAEEIRSRACKEAFALREKARLELEEAEMQRARSFETMQSISPISLKVDEDDDDECKIDLASEQEEAFLEWCLSGTVAHEVSENPSWLLLQ